MTKQNFISMSLESGLKYDIKSDLYQYPTLIGIRKDYLEFNYHGVYLSFQKDFVGKPILRPLSDLTKEIEHGGEKFVPIDRVAEFFIEGTEDVLEQSIAAIEYFIENNFFSRMEYLPFILFQKLIEWHFDTYNLISKNQAIDINTLEINPYK